MRPTVRNEALFPANWCGTEAHQLESNTSSKRLGRGLLGGRGECRSTFALPIIPSCLTTDGAERLKGSAPCEVVCAVRQHCLSAVRVETRVLLVTWLFGVMSEMSSGWVAVITFQSRVRIRAWTRVISFHSILLWWSTAGLVGGKCQSC